LETKEYKPDQHHFHKMNVQKSSKPRIFALTLIELLVIVAIIGVLAGLLLPVYLNAHRERGYKFIHARVEMKNLQAAISSYDTAYGHLPIPDSDTNSDVTFGISSTAISEFQKIPATRLIASNSDLMIILLDVDRGVNAGHKLNPQKTVFIDPKRVNDAKSPGVSTVDDQLRDPWGNPYIITLDSNHDNECRDAGYANAAVSQHSGSVGYYGLSSTNGNGTNFELKSDVMIWSRGPDGKTSADDKANAGVNKDNVLSWQ
jgi:type II secretory pathway pseudopilin PulG